MAGFVLFRGSSVCSPKTLANAADRMRCTFLKFRDPANSLRADTVVSAPLCRATKFDGPQSSVTGIFKGPDHGSWITGVGRFSYEGHLVGGRPGLIGQMLDDLLVHGLGIYDRLDGIFVLAHYNADTDSIWILPSVTGAQPVFLRESEEGVGVATSVLALVALGATSVDPMAVYSMLRSQRIPVPHTLFQEISSVPPGQALEITPRQTISHMVWAPALHLRREGDLPETVDRIATDLVATCKGLLNGKQGVVADITGGYDSRTACAALTRAAIPFSCTVSGAEEDSDVVCARRIADGEHIGLQVLPSPGERSDELIRDLADAVRLGEGQQDAFKLGGILYNKARLHAGNLRITVYGLYGEFYRDRTYSHGYLVDLEQPGPVKLDRLVRFSDYYDRAPWPSGLFRRNWRMAWRESLLRELRETASRFQEVSRGAQLDALFMNTQATHAGAPNHLMLSRYPHVAPLASTRALSRALSVPPRWRRAARLQVEIVQRLEPSLARYPMADGVPFEAISSSNWYRFLPAYRAKYTRFLKKASYGFGDWRRSGRHTSRTAGSNVFAPLIAQERRPGGALHHASMITGDLYDAAGFDKFFAGYEKSSFGENNLVSSIFTLEALSRLADLHDFQLAW